MINVNEYFGGTVKSLGFQDAQGKATVGVMEAGDYEFGTSTPETMQVISGEMSVKLPGQASFGLYRAGGAFKVPANEKFQLKLSAPAAYLCVYR